ncbi:MAG TPA: DedA family protein [Vicinamibacterales bacterium]
MSTLIDLFLHLDAHLLELAAEYGSWLYAILFAIVFAETGLVFTPFLPGDSLLFATGALAATAGPDGRPLLRLDLVAVLLLAAAILGDAVNYAVGRYVGPKIFHADDRSSFWHRVLNRDHLDRAHAFFERYGGKAVVLGRFVPIVRTFVPFVAGAGAMTYGTFAFYNVVGAVAWVGICIGLGYLFGNVPFIKDNFSLVVLGIIFVSVLPALFEFLKERRRRAAGVTEAA